MSNVERLMALADEYARHAALQGMAIGADSSKAEMAADMEDASRADLLAAIERLAAPAEPVAWMFFTRHKRTARRDEFAAIDWLPEPDDERELIEKRPLVYAHLAQPADALAASQPSSPLGRDADWVLAIATALGTDSGYHVPIVPDPDELRRLFDAVKAQPADAQAAVCCGGDDKCSGEGCECHRLRAELAQAKAKLAEHQRAERIVGAIIERNGDGALDAMNQIDKDDALAQLAHVCAELAQANGEVEAMQKSLDANWVTHQRVVQAEARADAALALLLEWNSHFDAPPYLQARIDALTGGSNG